MKRLLSIELQKIWQNKASRILTIIYFLSLSLLATVALIEFDFGIFKFEAAKSGFFNFPYIWHFTTYIASWLKIFLAVIIVSMIANEYSYGTLKQNLIDGMSKKEFLDEFDLDTNFKTVCFSCGDISTSKNDELYIESIANAISNVHWSKQGIKRSHSPGS